MLRRRSRTSFPEPSPSIKNRKNDAPSQEPILGVGSAAVSRGRGSLYFKKGAHEEVAKIKKEGLDVRLVEVDDLLREQFKV
jgi:hypothetical protein